MTRTPILFAVLAALGLPAVAQERSTDDEQPSTSTQASLGWEFQVGSSDAYEQTAKLKLQQTTPMGAATTDMNLVSRYTLTVKAVDPKGTGTLELRYDSMKMKVSNQMGTVVDFDSARPEDMERAKTDPQTQNLAAMIGQKQEIKITRAGKVLSVTGGTGNLTTVGDWQAIFLQMPAKALAQGGTWKTTRVTNKQMRMDFSCDHTLMTLNGKKGTVKSKYTAKADFSQNPMMANAKVTVTKSVGKQTEVVDFGKGRLESLSGTFAMNLEIAQSVQGQQMTITQSMSTENKVKWLGKGTAKKKEKPKTGGSDF